MLDAERKALLEAAATLFGFDSESEIDELERGSARNFSITDRDAKAHIRLYNEQHPLLERLIFEVELLAHLADRGVNVARPWLSVEGRYVEWCDIADVGRPLIVSDLLPGTPPQSFDSALAEAFGRLVAALHVGADEATWPGLPDQLDFEELSGKPTQAILFGRVPTDVASMVASTSEDVESRLALLQGPQSWGVIHADLHAGNVLVADGVPSLIDFGSAGVGPRAYDLALAWLTLQPFGWAEFVRGYSDVRPIEEAELNSVRPLAKARMIRDCAMCLDTRTHQPGGVWSYDALMAMCHSIDTLAV